MALTVEDGSIVANANSYVSVGTADTYFEDRNSSEWAAASDEQKLACLLYAAQWLDNRYDWQGQIVDDTQELMWPRIGVYDTQYRTISSTTIPSCLLAAQCEAAVASLAAGLNEVRERGGMVQYARVDALAVSFAPGAPAGRTFPYIDQLVSKVAAPWTPGILRTVR